MNAKEARKKSEENREDEDYLTEVMVRDAIRETVDKGRFEVTVGYPLSQALRHTLRAEGYVIVTSYSQFVQVPMFTISW